MTIILYLPHVQKFHTTDGDINKTTGKPQSQAHRRSTNVSRIRQTRKEKKKEMRLNRLNDWTQKMEPKIRKDGKMKNVGTECPRLMQPHANPDSNQKNRSRQTVFLRVKV